MTNFEYFTKNTKVLASLLERMVDGNPKRILGSKCRYCKNPFRCKECFEKFLKTERED